MEAMLNAMSSLPVFRAMRTIFALSSSSGSATGTSQLPTKSYAGASAGMIPVLLSTMAMSSAITGALSFAPQ